MSIHLRTTWPCRGTRRRGQVGSNDYLTRFSICIVFLAALSLVVPLAGCTTKAKAKADARAAYMVGQQQSLERMLMARSSVTVIGPVRNPLITWTADLTLAKALISADYYPKTGPREIVIVRNGQPIPVDPNQLLAGDDVPLEAGDVVNIRQ